MNKHPYDAAWLCLAGRVCVITGAGSGIGAETARQFALAGAVVAVVDRDGCAVASVADGIVQRGGRAIGVVADVAQTETVAAAAARVADKLGACQVLVNCAAARRPGPLLTLSPQAWNEVLDVNLTGALLCTQAFAPQMIAAGRGGSIVHVGSITGHHPLPASGAYSVSKSGLNMLSQLLAVELAPHGIRSNVVTPGFVRTPATEAAYADSQVASARARAIPAGRIGDAADQAHAILFLASDRAGYINGQDLVVDGGVVRGLLGVVATPGRAAPPA